MLSVPLQQAELSVELGFRPGRYNENVGDGRKWARRSQKSEVMMYENTKRQGHVGKLRPVTSDMLMI